jgi:hypothetical protein
MILSSFRDRLKDNGHPAVAVSLLALLSSEGKNAVKSPLTLGIAGLSIVWRTAAEGWADSHVAAGVGLSRGKGKQAGGSRKILPPAVHGNMTH